MTVKPFDDNDALSRWAADYILEALRKKPNLTLCPASGNSPLLCYRLLAEHARQEPSLFEQIRIVQLDEFLAAGNDGRAVGDAFMREYILEPLQVHADQYLGFDINEDPEQESKRMQEQLTEWGPIDLCVLGLGLNGHLGLNEPAGELALHAHVATLQPSSQEHHMLQGTGEKPSRGITLGMGDLLHAREVLLLINGRHKQAATRELLRRRITTGFPGSLLWLHPGAVCAADREALGGE
jgi:galactosamine-6-phosphate isomerase